MDFMFQLTKEEMDNWKSQIVISNSDIMGLRKRPLAFTEQGVAMLSAILTKNISENLKLDVKKFNEQFNMFFIHSLYLNT